MSCSSSLVTRSRREESSPSCQLAAGELGVEETKLDTGERSCGRGSSGRWMIGDGCESGGGMGGLREDTRRRGLRGECVRIGCRSNGSTSRRTGVSEVGDSDDMVVGGRRRVGKERKPEGKKLCDFS